jgi:hypothetical protein
MAYIPSVWKELGVSPRSALFGIAKKKEKKIELPTEKELRRMRLKECDPYVNRFDGRISANSKMFARRKKKKAK